MKKQRWYRFFFLIYCTVMLWLLLVRAVPDLGDMPYWEYVIDSLVLKPGRTIKLFWKVIAQPEHYIDLMGLDWYIKNRAHAIYNLAGNVLLFIPLGFFLPTIWSRLQKWWKTLLISALLVTFVEILQALTLQGTCDVDDLILNTLGALIVYLGFCITKKSPKKRKKK